MKKTGLKGYVYDFSVDYSDTTVDDILDIHNYLIKNNDVVPGTIIRTGIRFLYKSLLSLALKYSGTRY